MSKITFEEACEKHAQNVGYDTWYEIPKDARPYHYKRVAELLAKSWANEAVKEDRESLHFWINIPPLDFSRDAINRAVLSRPSPLPYPEIS